MPAPRSLAKIAIASAAAGFGFAGGRSLWRWVEKNWLMAGFLAAVAGGVGFAAYLLTRGGRAPSAAVVATAVFALALVVFFGTQFFNTKEPGNAMIFVAWQGAAAAAGALVGLSVRGKRQAVLDIEKHNEQFLANQGIRAVGGREETWIDGSGREMVLHDTRHDAIVFRIPGVRNGRARIELDASGRMTNFVLS